MYTVIWIRTKYGIDAANLQSIKIFAGDLLLERKGNYNSIPDLIHSFFKM